MHMKQFDSFLELLNIYKIDNDDIEVLHKLRVSSRKLSSILKRKSELSKNLRTLRKLSNEMRDLDVFEDEFFKSLKSTHQKKLLKLGLENFIKIRKNILKVDFLLFLQSISWIELPLVISKKKIVLDNEVNYLEAPSQESDDIHKFRINVKKLRYRLEHSESENDRLIQLLKKMQEFSGKIHDIDVALIFLQEFLVGNKFIEFSEVVNLKRINLYEKLLKSLEHYLELKSA